ncbi:MAG: PPK2 family polyphosphate kinase [Chloroflexota bacterium]
MSHATVIDGSRHVSLERLDPADELGMTESAATAALEPVAAELLELQELLYAAETHGVLVILQGMDAAGKDVTIRNVFAAATPEAIRVRHFKPMTDEEEKHDFLWRAHGATPARGEIVIFDRSYYEQLVLPEVEGESTPAKTAERAEDVRAFETILRHGGVIVVKFFLHIGNDEQERRLVERMERPDSAWKISARDWTAREAWDRYMAAYEDTMNSTATPESPWYLVPANRQWVHNLVVAETLVERLRPHRDEWIEAREARGAKKAAEAREVAKRRVTA